MTWQQLHDYAEEELLYNRFMESALLGALSNLSPPNIESIVLDAGCGPGAFPSIVGYSWTKRYSGCG
jgi:hypothetical protein